MIRELSFCADGRAQFIRRSYLPVERASMFALAIRRIMDELHLAVGEGVSLEAPIAIEPAVWQNLRADQLCSTYRGDSGCAVLLLSKRSADAIVASAFGEIDGDGGAGKIGAQILERFADALVPAFTILCAENTRRIASTHFECVTFFEVRCGGRAAIEIGVALACDPPLPLGPRIDPRALFDCPIECAASLGSAIMTAAALCALQIGDVVPLAVKVGSPAALNVQGASLALVEPGVAEDRHAVCVQEMMMELRDDGDRQ